MAAEIGLKGYRRGIFTDDYAKQPPKVRKEEERKEAKSASPTKGGNRERNIMVREHSHQK